MSLHVICISVYFSDAGILKQNAIESNIVLQDSIWYFKNSNRKIRRIYKNYIFICILLNNYDVNIH